MHRIVQAHLSSYVGSAALQAEDESSQFEKFVNYSILSNIASGDFDIEEVSTGAGDDGTDGIAVIVDEEIVVSGEDAEIAFASSRRNHDVVTLHLSNYQIVNGCQTSNVLFEGRDHLRDTMVNIKVVETQNEDVFSELVRATNSQSKVEETQFLSLKPIIKRVEQYFNTFNDDGRLAAPRRPSIAFAK